MFEETITGVRGWLATGRDTAAAQLLELQEAWRSSTLAGKVDEASARLSEELAAPVPGTDFKVEQVVVLLAVVILAYLVVLIGVRRLRRQHAFPDLRTSTRMPRVLGIVAISILVVFFGAWSYRAPLASASLANGVVSPDGSSKSVTHLEGGIIRSILVEEGQTVNEGDLLVVLDDVAARARRNEMFERLMHLLAHEARLETELAGRTAIAFPEVLMSSDDPAFSRILDIQRKHFDQRQATLRGRRHILEQRILQLEAQNEGIKEVVASRAVQIGLLDQEIANVQQLLDSGLARAPRLLELKRERSEVIADRASSKARLHENEQKIGETELQLVNLDEEFLEAVSAELTDVRRTVAELKSALPSREDVLQRTAIHAPVSGTVLGLAVNTVSGVVIAGQEILTIVPKDAPLVIDAQVRPSDIDRVYPGMTARVILSAYKQRNMPMIHGSLRTISADRMIEDRTGEPYFLAKVEVFPEDIAKLSDVRMVPGMPAEVMLLEEERSLIDIILDPLAESLRASFKEG